MISPYRKSWGLKTSVYLTLLLTAGLGATPCHSADEEIQVYLDDMRAPNFTLANGGGPVTASLDMRLSRAVNDKTQVGLEAYTEWGPLRHLEAADRNGKTLFAVLDHDFGDVDLNLGIGRGLTGDADRWVLKFILGTTF